MTDDEYKTMRVPADKWEQAKAQKEAAGRTWGEQIVRDEADDETVAIYAAGSDEPVDEVLAEAVGGQDADLAELRHLVERIPERTAAELADEFGGHP